MMAKKLQQYAKPGVDPSRRSNVGMVTPKSTGFNKKVAKVKAKPVPPKKPNKLVGKKTVK